jgi:transposase
VKLLWDLQEARERLKANSQTSSRPPSSDAPWQGKSSEAEEAEESEPVDAEGEALAPTETSPEPELAKEKSADTATNKPKKPGRSVGAPGPSRQLTLPISATIWHPPETCARCGQALEAEAFIARTGLDVLDVEHTAGDGLQGLQVRHDKQLYGEISCPCGHVNRTEPGRCPSEPLWEVQLSEWHLVGPMLLSLIVCLSQRMRLSRRRTKNFCVTGWAWR